MTMHARRVSGALVCTDRNLGAAVNGITFYVHVTAPNNEMGMSAYFEADISGTVAGNCYGLGSWINTEGASPVVGSHLLTPFEGGVYTGEAQANAFIVFGGQFQAILAGAPGHLFAFRFNTNQTVTALMQAGSPGSVGFVAGAGTNGTQVGYIPLAAIAGTAYDVNPVWVRVYATAT